MKRTLCCSVCGAESKGLYLHHGKLFCGLCLAADADDELVVKARITVIRAQETRDRLRRLRRKK